MTTSQGLSFAIRKNKGVGADDLQIHFQLKYLCMSMFMWVYEWVTELE